jgi:hypothetical protein
MYCQHNSLYPIPPTYKNSLFRPSTAILNLVTEITPLKNGGPFLNSFSMSKLASLVATQGGWPQPMLSPTHDLKIFLSKISGKTPAELLPAADEEVQGVFSSPKKRSISFPYLLDLILLINYINVPPQKLDRRGPVPEQFKPTLRGLGLIPE